MFVTTSKSKNLVQDLSEMIKAGKQPAVYFALFDGMQQISVLKEALGVLELKPTGCLQDEALMKIRSEKAWPAIMKVENNCKQPLFTLEQVKSQQDAVIVVQNDPKYFYLMRRFFEKNQVKCRLFHYEDIRSSAVVDGKIRVINRLEYLNEWPWIMDILLKDMPVSDREGFSSRQVAARVNSNGSYYHYADKETKWSKIENGMRFVPGYTPLEGKKKYTLTLLGDSRFFNSFFPASLTLAAYLQKAVNKAGLNCEVKNFSVEANTIQNQFAMLKSMELQSDDLVLAVVTPLGTSYKGYTEENFQMNLRVKANVMKQMYEYCRSKGANLMFVHLPGLKDIANLTELEKTIADSYGIAYNPDRGHEKIKQYCMVQDIKYIDFTDVITNYPRTCFFVDTTHFSPEGCRHIAGIFSQYAKVFFEKEMLLETDEVKNLAETSITAHAEYVVEARFKGMTEFVANLKKTAEGKPENCGAIVMNCNPFTLGHRYLIETAASQVDHLYVLAVEEDKSVFKFKDRIEMMRRGTADIPNVEVIPSGKFVISSLTFPGYFEKSKKPDAKVDTTMDIEIFCTYIAPNLHVKTRFVGEEPLDMVTNQYNQNMKKLLPEFGMTLVEIPRKESGEAPISASRVRKYLEEKQYEEVKKIVPKTTYDYLVDVLGY